MPEKRFRLEIEMIFKMKRLSEISKGVSADRKTGQLQGLTLGAYLYLDLREKKRHQEITKEGMAREVQEKFRHHSDLTAK